MSFGLLDLCFIFPYFLVLVGGHALILQVCIYIVGGLPIRVPVYLLTA